jgi:hypothetical protein
LEGADCGVTNGGIVPATSTWFTIQSVMEGACTFSRIGRAICAVLVPG